MGLKITAERTKRQDHATRVSLVGKTGTFVRNVHIDSKKHLSLGYARCARTSRVSGIQSEVPLDLIMAAVNPFLQMRCYRAARISTELPATGRQTRIVGALARG